MTNQKEQIQVLLNQEAVKRSMILRMVITQMGITQRSLMTEWGITAPTCAKYLNDILLLDQYDLVFLSEKLQVSTTAMHDLVQGKYESPEEFISQNNIKIY